MRMKQRAITRREALLFSLDSHAYRKAVFKNSTRKEQYGRELDETCTGIILKTNAVMAPEKALSSKEILEVKELLLEGNEKLDSASRKAMPVIRDILMAQKRFVFGSAIVSAGIFTGNPYVVGLGFAAMAHAVLGPAILGRVRGGRLAKALQNTIVDIIEKLKQEKSQGQAAQVPS